MKAPDFGYLRPASVDEALAALARHGEEAMVLAGGQSLMAMHNLRVARAGVLVDVNRIPGLDGIRDGGDHLVIGTLARLSALEASDLVRERVPLLAQALPHVAHPAIRNRATLGGSLALADPAAEMPACCLALGATVIAAGPAGSRPIAAGDFFTGLYQTALRPGELITGVHVPCAAPGDVARFAELARRRGDFAVAGAALVAAGFDGALHAPRLALLGVADRAVLAHAAMELLDGRALARLDGDALGRALDRDVDPLDDPACPPAYRRQVVRVLVQRLLDGIREGGP